MLEQQRRRCDQEAHPHKIFNSSVFQSCFVVIVFAKLALADWFLGSLLEYIEYVFTIK